MSKKDQLRVPYLKDRIGVFVANFEQYQLACTKLNEFISLDIERPSDALTSFIQEHIKDIVEAANKRTNNRSVATIKVSDLPEPFNSFYAQDRNRNSEMWPLAVETLNSFNEAILRDAAGKLSNTLELSGFEESAQYLGHRFDLLCHSRPTETKLRRVKGRIVLRKSEYGDSFDKRNNIVKLIPHLEAYEAETGCVGMSAAFKAYHEKLSQLTALDRSLSSGTVVNEGGTAEIKVFKEHINVCVAPEVFEALYGFIGAYITPAAQLVKISDAA